MNRLQIFAIACRLCICAPVVFGVEPGPKPAIYDSAKNWCVRLTAVVQKEPPAISLVWMPIVNSGPVTVTRTSKGSFEWTKLAELPAGTTKYNDQTAVVGWAYEYKVQTSVDVAPFPEKIVAMANTARWTPPSEGARRLRFGYILAGIDVPAIESRGTVVLVVETAQAEALRAEINRLIEDLTGDGWQVVRHDVASTQSPPALRAMVQEDYHNDPKNVRSLFLLGHLPVARSGDFSPDGHPERRGAQPADCYYGDIDGQYTDTTVNRPNSMPRNRNVPGDGRFDQSLIPGKTMLDVGRVDFDDMPAFAPLTATDLLRRYLDKDHNYRHKVFSLSPRALLHDGLGRPNDDWGGSTLATSLYRSCWPMYGDRIIEESATGWLKRLCAEDFQWAYCCAGSGPDHCGSIVATKQLVDADPKTGFTMMLGSYFGDWPFQNDIMRGMIAAKSYTLTCIWSGTPQMDFHAMALGETIGYGLRWSERPEVAAGAHAGFTHTSLMGDPTLRLHILAPPGNPKAQRRGPLVELTWAPSANASRALGYHVYRSSHAAGPYTRLTTLPLPACNFIDETAPSEPCTYMVRTLALEQSASGSYFNLSQGRFVQAPKP